MDANALLSGLNMCIAAAMLVWTFLFFYRLYKNRLEGTRQVFLIVMGIGYVFLALDYTTTGILRIEGSTMLPQLSHAPTGILLLIVWRVAIACTLWGLILYIISNRHDAQPPEDRED